MDHTTSGSDRLGGWVRLINTIKEEDLTGITSEICEFEGMGPQSDKFVRGLAIKAEEVRAGMGGQGAICEELGGELR